MNLFFLIGYLARSGWPALEPAFVERIHKVRKFWTIAAMEFDRQFDVQSKENVYDSRGFILLQLKLAFFPDSRNK